METDQNIGIAFYQSLGKLFYAVAAADKVVRDAELNALKYLVQSEWLVVDEIEDEFGVDAAFQIEVVFDWLDYETANAATNFKEFASFYNENKSLFSENINALIWTTCNAIAWSFAGNNKSELAMLGRLKLLFESH